MYKKNPKVCSSTLTSSAMGNALVPASDPPPGLIGSINNTQEISLPQSSNGNPHGNIFSGAYIHG